MVKTQQELELVKREESREEILSVHCYIIHYIETTYLKPRNYFIMSMVRESLLIYLERMGIYVDVLLEIKIF
jgi:hypothetical protein